jgi:hypothetical protein
LLNASENWRRSEKKGDSPKSVGKRSTFALERDATENGFEEGNSNVGAFEKKRRERRC